MDIKFSSDELKAILRLQTHPDFPVLMNAMAKFAENGNKQLVMRHLEVGQMYSLQGEVRGIVRLIEALTDVQSKISELSKPKK